MKQKFIMMWVLIQGPKQPGIDIDVYLRPLIEELLLLWSETGVRVWDEYKQEHFDLQHYAESYLHRTLGIKVEKLEI